MRALFRLIPLLLLSLASLIAVPLLVCSVILWPRSYWYGDSFWANQHNHGHAAISATGHLVLLDTIYHPTAPFTVPANIGRRLGSKPHDPRPSFHDPGPHHPFYFAGFGHYTAGDFISTKHAVLLPFWFITLASALPPLLLFHHLRTRRRAHRLAQHLCLKCAYDLRATTDRCPECGTPIASPAMPALPRPHAKA